MIAIYFDDTEVSVWTNTEAGDEGVHVGRGRIGPFGKDGRCLAIGKNAEGVRSEAIKEIEKDLASLRAIELMGGGL